MRLVRSLFKPERTDTMRKLLSLCALLFLLAPAAVPQGGKHPCEGAETQFEATQCAAREYKQADAELNRV